jgi:hypothetical protein
MATKANLMGMGVSPLLARRQATDPQTITAAGGSLASATGIGGDNYFVSVIASNTGAGLLLPQVGTDNGALLGDDYIINNQLTASITVFGPVGSTISISGVNVSGSAGFGLSTHKSVTLYPITASSWLGIVSA